MFDPTLADQSKHPDLATASAAAFGHLRDAVAPAMDPGALRAGDVDTTTLTACATVHGVSTLLIDGQLAKKGFTDDPRVIAAWVTAIMFLGLRPENAPKR